MPFCVEYFEHNRWKIMKNTIRASKDEAEVEKERVLACMLNTDNTCTVKDQLRIKRIREKEAKSLLGDNYGKV